MRTDRIIQAGALTVVVGAASAGGSLLPRINELTQQHTLRYTDVAVESAPPFVILGTVIGALRGIIVDYLWIKVHLMKEKGLYFEIMEDSDLITKLQPRFAAVWAFHGHNMAYNISVAHNTAEERWEWVKAGIDLVRNKGLRYNPNDLQLHKELSFWFSHKIEGFADDAHFYYKTELAREWHSILGPPPYDAEERTAWMKNIADAPETLEAAERRTPGVLALVERLRSAFAPYEQQFKFALDKSFLEGYARWRAVDRNASPLGGAARVGERPDFLAFDEIASDPEARDAWNTLLAHVRKRVLVDEYNMDPQLMYEYTRDYGPIDWRSGFAHALYWALRGTYGGEIRVLDEEDVYKIVNNDRMKIQAMQGLARWGRIGFDPFSSDVPSRFPDARWIDSIDRYWEELTIKHKDTRGPGADLFMGFHQNFMANAVRHMYRQGDWARAQRYLDRLEELYGTWDPKYSLDLRDFVWQEIEEQYEFQPHLAPSEVAAALEHGYRVGLGLNRPEVYERAMKFAADVTEFFKTNKYNYFETKMGTQRLADLIGRLQQSAPIVFAQVMVGSTNLVDRLRIWQNAPNDLQLQVYDVIKPEMERQLAMSELAPFVTIDQVLPAPVGIEEYRRMLAAEAERRRREAQESDRAPVERR